MVCNPRFHRRSDLQTSVNPDEVILREVERDSGLVAGSAGDVCDLKGTLLGVRPLKLDPEKHPR